MRRPRRRRRAARPGRAAGPRRTAAPARRGRRCRGGRAGSAAAAAGGAARRPTRPGRRPARPAGSPTAGPAARRSAGRGPRPARPAARRRRPPSPPGRPPRAPEIAARSVGGRSDSGARSNSSSWVPGAAVSARAARRSSSSRSAAADQLGPGVHRRGPRAQRIDRPERGQRVGGGRVRLVGLFGPHAAGGCTWASSTRYGEGSRGRSPSVPQRCPETSSTRSARVSAT